MRRKKITLSKKLSRILPSNPTVKLLTVCFSLITAPLLALLSEFSNDILRFPSYALAVYPQRFEYIMASLTLTVSGALIMEYSLRSNGD